MIFVKKNQIREDRDNFPISELRMTFFLSPPPPPRSHGWNGYGDGYFIQFFDFCIDEFLYWTRSISWEK